MRQGGMGPQTHRRARRALVGPGDGVHGRHPRLAAFARGQARRQPHRERVDGGHDLHLRLLRAKGVTLTGHFVAAGGGRLRFDDDLAATIAWDDARYREFAGLVETLCAERGIERPELPDPEPFDEVALDSIEASAIGTVILSGGFRPDYSWVRMPDAFDAMGFPVQVDGSSDVMPGLFFAGVHFLRKRRSSLLCGVGEDAAIVADAVARHLDAGGPGAEGPNGPGPTT